VLNASEVISDYPGRPQTTRINNQTRAWLTAGHVFTTPVGKPVAPDRMTRLFAELVAASCHRHSVRPTGIPGLRQTKALQE